GPIASSIFDSGHSTTVTKGNMYSFDAIAAAGDSQCTTVGRRYSAFPCFTTRGWSPRYVAVTSATPGDVRSASIDCAIASATPGTVKAARLESGCSGGSGCTVA